MFSKDLDSPSNELIQVQRSIKNKFKIKRKFVLFFIIVILLDAVFFKSLFPQTNPQEVAETKPLLRVFPSYRKEECDWAIRWDICLSCLRIGRRYAQKIHFYPSGPYREHGCYSEEEGFFLMEE
ncbi:hypothetical protein MAL08_18565 [Leptospira noguchii]|uniref:hypothetical protein n=1 Tax=Leptospira noguchii TaxID=28182 RepID=UPI0002BF063A|nr:hypothetical protein [Leptospira noguchii]EMI69169.1 hypothetical protein LEP1GSC072_2489 [Leptospira noguchii str. Bonito]EMS89669.1 hypothetical protein LEP1GSC073_3447 [Leptospira noguchii str. Cascata]UOG32393.1 hypothetical protein MAL06_19595 [Leptospira noguchii]UOG39621.1 hypothetical protein MAL08_18565 [Leptospira noguchii]UOG43355.1 hypothetical protein MAL05_18475 [Leptospira noguchii]